MAKTIDNNVHLHNIFRLWLPVLWMFGLSASFMVGAYVFKETYIDMAFVFCIISTLSVLASFPMIMYCAARNLEYDRLRTEILRSGATTITNPKIDSYMNKLFSIPGRQLVMALGLMTLKHPPASRGEALAHVAGVQKKRAKRLPPAKIFTKDWWAACFSPAQLV